MATTDAFSRALAFERTGRISEAEQIYRQVLTRTPSHLPSLMQLAQLAVRTGRPRSALPYFERAVRSKPLDSGLRAALGGLCLHLHRPDLAERHLRRAAESSSATVEDIRNLAYCNYSLGHGGEAARLYQAALARRPDDPPLMLALARTYDTDGDTAAAETLYKRIVALDGRHAAAYDGLAHCRTYAEEPSELGKIEALLPAANLPAGDRLVLHFAAGKILQDLARYDEAFHHFLRGNALRQPSFDLQAFSRQVEQLSSTFTADFFRRRAAFADASERPIFVIGMPRSGTTLVEQILSSHPQVSGANELEYFADAVAELRGNRRDFKSFLDAAVSLSGDDARRIAGGYLELLSAYDAAALRVVDKMPHNFERLWLIVLLFPKAKFIHCRRDPLDNCVSCFTNLLGGVHNYAGDLTTLGGYYRRYEALMNAWRNSLPVAILDVQYENLVSDHEAVIRRIVSHAGLPWDKACLDFHTVKRGIRTPSRNQVRQAIHAGSVGIWRRYAAHLKSLTDALDRDGISGGPD